MRLKYIAHVSFVKSEQTNFLDLKKVKKLPKLGQDDVVLFISKGEDQLVFVYGFAEWEMECADGESRPVRFLHSERVRIKGAKWSALMIANYASNAGIHLEGIKRLEWHIKKEAKAA